MLALTLDSAKNIALIVLVVLLAAMVASAWLIKNITTKAITVLIVAGLAFAVYSQRSSLSDCADKFKDKRDLSAETCSFFGRDVTVGRNG